MTPAARISAAITCLDLILAGEPAEKTLTGWARGSRFAGSSDRAAVRDLVYDALRHLRSYEALGGARDGRGLMIGALRASGSEVNDFFTGEGYAPSPLSAAEHAAERTSDLPLDFPDWVASRLHAQYGGAFVTKLNELYHQRAPVTLRVRQAGGSLEAAARSLAAEGIATRPHPTVETALIVTEGARRLRASKPYLQGMVELQDAGAQALCQAIPVDHGARVLDYCAGGGGKILALCDRARIEAFAYDINPARMKDLPGRAKRAGARVRLLGANDLPQQKPFDLVLCDVPCSGSGTWRRAPDEKWRIKPETLDRLAGIQRDILTQASELLAPRGVLIYATCSIFREENEAVVSTMAPAWRVLSQDTHLPDEFGDGFYWAKLQRRDQN